MSYLVLARKWRPQKFEDLVGQETIARILKNAITGNKVAHAYIFSGPRGVGKTSTARILAKALNCEKGPTPDPCGKCASCTAVSDGSSIDVSEIDGASNTGVDNIRDLREKVRYAPSGGRYKVYIIDEAHMLSTSAFNALLKTLEEPPPHAVFVLATTEPKKIPPTVLSRCQHLPFRRITGQKIKERLTAISGAEAIKVTDSALEMVARAAEGSMRDSLTILDQIASFSEDITESDVKDLLGITDVGTLSLLSAAVIEGDRKAILNIIADLTNTGTDLKAFTKDLLQFIRNLLISSIVGDTGDVLDLSEEERSAISDLGTKTTEEHLALLLSELIKAEPGIRNALFTRTALEMALIRLSLLSHFSSIDMAIRSIGGVSASATRGGAAAGKAAVPKQRAETAPAPSGAKKNMSGASLDTIWSSVLESLDETQGSLTSKLRDAAASFGDDGIRLVYNSDMLMHIDSVQSSIPALENKLKELSGRKIPVKIETIVEAGQSKKDLKEKALQNPIVREALELFEGRILDVLPNKESE